MSNKKIIQISIITCMHSCLFAMEIGEDTIKLIAQEAQKARIKKAKSLSSLPRKRTTPLTRTKSAPVLSAQEAHKKLIRAIKDNKPDQAKKFIKNEIINKADNNQRTPLMFAAMFNNGTLVKLLLDKGADPHRTNHNGNSPLHIALLKEIVNVGIVQLLLDAGARVTLENNKGQRPAQLLRKKIKKNPALKQIKFS